MNLAQIWILKSNKLKMDINQMTWAINGIWTNDVTTIKFAKGQTCLKKNQLKSNLNMSKWLSVINRSQTSLKFKYS